MCPLDISPGFLIERGDPNKELYWKEVVYDEERPRPLYNCLENIDW